MFANAARILSAHKLPFEIVRPLILETAFKVMDADPATVQTGPAKRKDEKTMKRHKAMLKDDEALAKIYAKISKSIGR